MQRAVDHIVKAFFAERWRQLGKPAHMGRFDTAHTRVAEKDLRRLLVTDKVPVNSSHAFRDPS